MISKMHFISGLPRSGSTLLSAILKQNPRFRAAVTSPLALLTSALLNNMSGAHEFSVFFNDEKRHTVLRSVFDGYYADAVQDTVVFDTNRTWTAKAPVIAKLYPNCRIICCVRDVGEILNSVEAMLRKNPLQLSRIFNFQPGNSVYARAEILMNLDHGLIGQAWSGFREAWFSDQARRLIVIQYDSLAGKPAEVMARLYTELEEASFAHDFDNVICDEPDYDAHIGMPGMHAIRQTVSLEKKSGRLPPDLPLKYAAMNFWQRSETNQQGVLVL